MTKLIPGNQKHLSLDDRLYIEHQLDLGTSFKDIARFLCKDPTTISREVKKRRYSDWSHAKILFFSMLKISVSTAFIARKPTSAIRSSHVV